MSKFFNLNLNIEFSHNIPKEIIEIFIKKAEGKKWNVKDKSIIPFEYEIEYLFETEIHQREQCLQIFNFHKQEYLLSSESHNSEKKFYCFHLSRTIKDDGFYQGGYELIVWLAKYSRTNSYIGEFHEPESKEVKNMFTENGIVTVINVPGGKSFKMSTIDFNF